MQNEIKKPADTTKARENLQARYKPIGLRAVVAATQCKPGTKAEKPRRERDIPAALQPLFD
ncbi:hypothetical protein GB928_016555 [Shinella curvata]|uniref:Uncharacterized protein n=1 Tax=Shinella curvata TaxID=1817964 RepID=A0ABT8XGH4_9HYPH|nr:hypothetical protein [Shinella curvata]MCJ8053474.1 hypothetical protein [Shinella curvata]MDO6122806.1 hypothetical protein [Shinella curvata]